MAEIDLGEIQGLAAFEAETKKAERKRIKKERAKAKKAERKRIKSESLYVEVTVRSGAVHKGTVSRGELEDYLFDDSSVLIVEITQQVADGNKKTVYEYVPFHACDSVNTETLLSS